MVAPGIPETLIAIGLGHLLARFEKLADGLTLRQQRAAVERLFEIQTELAWPERRTVH